MRRKYRGGCHRNRCQNVGGGVTEKGRKTKKSRGGGCHEAKI